MKELNLKKDDCIHSIDKKVGKLAKFTAVNYWYCKHFEEWRVVDFATIQSSKWSMIDAENLFASLPYSNNAKDKELSAKTLFRVKSKAKAIKIIKQILNNFN